MKTINTVDAESESSLTRDLKAAAVKKLQDKIKKTKGLTQSQKEAIVAREFFSDDEISHDVAPELSPKIIKKPVIKEEAKELSASADNNNFITPDELLETSLSQELEQESNIKTVSKELFNNNAIDLKSEVTHDEINDLTRIRFLKEAFGISHTDSLIVSFLSLRVSKNRQSRREFIEALQTENRNANQGGNFFSRLLGGGNNNNGGN